MPRREFHPYSTDMLEAVVSRLETASARLSAIRDLTAAREIEILQINNHKEMVKGLRKIDAFVKAAEEAMHDYRLGIEAEGMTTDGKVLSRKTPRRKAAGVKPAAAKPTGEKP